MALEDMLLPNITNKSQISGRHAKSPVDVQFTDPEVLLDTDKSFVGKLPNINNNVSISGRHSKSDIVVQDVSSGLAK